MTPLLFPLKQSNEVERSLSNAEGLFRLGQLIGAATIQIDRVRCVDHRLRVQLAKHGIKVMAVDLHLMADCRTELVDEGKAAAETR